MKKSKYTEEQIAFASKQAKTNTPVAEVIRRIDVSEHTFYRWKNLYDGLGVGELRRLKQLEDESRKLKQLVADLSLDKHILQDLLKKGFDGEQVVETVKRVAALRRAPRAIRVDNGPAVVSKVLDKWAYENGITLNFSRPGKPTDNAFVESFNGRLRDECLNANRFLSLAHARAKIEAWRRHYNESRPHTSLGGACSKVPAMRQHRWNAGGGWLTPMEYAAAATKQAAE